MGDSLPKSITVVFFKSVSKSVKCGVRVLRAKRASLTVGRVRHLSSVSLSVFSLVPDLLFDYSRVLEYAKIRTVLQSSTDLKVGRFLLHFV